MTNVEIDKVTLKITSDNNVEILVPVDFDDMSEAEKNAFLRFSAAGNQKSSLDKATMDIVEAGRIYLKGENTPEGLICRWDWTCWNV